MEQCNQDQKENCAYWLIGFWSVLYFFVEIGNYAPRRSKSTDPLYVTFSKIWTQNIMLKQNFYFFLYNWVNLESKHQNALNNIYILPSILSSFRLWEFFLTLVILLWSAMHSNVLCKLSWLYYLFASTVKYIRWYLEFQPSASSKLPENI